MSPRREHSLIDDAMVERLHGCLTERETQMFLAHLWGSEPPELAEMFGYSGAGPVRVKLNRIRWYIAQAFPEDPDIDALLERAPAA